MFLEFIEGIIKTPKRFIEGLMMSHNIGYARVSSTGQKLDVQRELLNKEKCFSIFEEKVSGKNRNRPELTLLLKTIRKGDTVVVSKLDRLARSMSDFWKIYDEIKETGASLKILNMGLDTNSSQGRLMLGILASVAEFERELIKERQADGIAKAKASGKHLGRPTIKEDIKIQIKELLQAGKTKPTIAKALNIGVSTIYKIQKELKGA